MTDKNDVMRPLTQASQISLGLSIIKALAYVKTDSLIVLASLLDSIADTVISYANFKLAKVSREGADKEHPFGHGGFEVVGSLIQGIVIALFGVALFLSSGRSFVVGKAEVGSESSLLFAIVVLCASAAGGFLIQYFLNRKKKQIDEREDRVLSIDADEAHYAGDAITNLVAALGLGLVYLTDLYFIDSLLGCVGGALLMRTAYPVLKQCYADIVHEEIDPKMQQEIVDIALTTDERVIGVHEFRTRQLGLHLFVNFHMQLKGDLSLREAHDINDAVEERIRARFPRADLLIHLDPETEEEHNAWDPGIRLAKDPKN